MTGQWFRNWWAPHSAVLPGLGPEPGPFNPAAPGAVTVPTAIGCPDCSASVCLQQQAGWRAPHSPRPSPHRRGAQAVPDPRLPCSRLRYGLGAGGICFRSPGCRSLDASFPALGRGEVPRNPRSSLQLPGGSRRPSVLLPAPAAPWPRYGLGGTGDRGGG